MLSSNFDAWFAEYLEQRPIQVKLLLDDKTAIRFLIAWSLLETSCFRGFAKGKELPDYCLRLVNEEGFDPTPLSSIIEYFHSRYQNKQFLANLMHGHSEPNIKPLLTRQIGTLSNYEKVFLIVSVVYRYRNNIFHGSKGVRSWLKYKPQIEHCIRVMQSLLTHAVQFSRKAANVSEDAA